MEKREWKDLKELEQARFILRYIREMFGLTDQVLEHSYNGDETPLDSGLINWKQYYEELTTKKKDKKEKKGTTKNVKRRVHAGSEPDSLPLFPMQDDIQGNT